MNDAIDTIEIDDKTRYALYLDTWTFDYLKEWEWDGLGVFTLRKSKWNSELELDALGLNNRLREIRGNDFIDNEKVAIATAISRAGYSYQFESLNDSSYWHEIVIYWDDKQITSIDGILDELRAWYCGEVYSVALETLETYVGRYRTIEQWEVSDSVSQVIFTHNYKFDLETCKDLLGERRAA
jgi:hypothetical protein